MDEEEKEEEEEEEASSSCIGEEHSRRTLDRVCGRGWSDYIPYHFVPEGVEAINLSCC
jgi:hypothetical protein